MTWTYVEIEKFVANKTGETSQSSEVEGPGLLGPYTVWRAWTFDGNQYHAHYVVGEESTGSLTLYQDFQPFANWLMKAFNASDSHRRRLDWFRNSIAGLIILTLLALVVWAIYAKLAINIDFKWLVAALATTSLGYLLGDWVRRPMVK